MNVAPASWPAVARTSSSALVHDEGSIHTVDTLAAQTKAQKKEMRELLSAYSRIKEQIHGRFSPRKAVSP